MTRRRHNHDSGRDLMTRYLRSVLIALGLLVVSATATLAWVTPQLVSECAPSPAEYAWTITLAQEEDQNIEFSFFSDFTYPFAEDFGSAGSHYFTTGQGGDTLYARYTSDHEAQTSAEANGELCEQPVPTPTPTPVPSETPAPVPTATPAPLVPLLPDTAIEAPTTTQTAALLLLVVLVGGLLYLARKHR